MRNRYQLRLLAVASVAVLGLVAAGCGGGSSASSAPTGGVAGAEHSTSTAAVMTRKISGLGVVLVNPKGRTLYVFMKDQRTPRHLHRTVRKLLAAPEVEEQEQADGRRSGEDLAAELRQESVRRPRGHLQQVAALHVRG